MERRGDGRVRRPDGGATRSGLRLLSTTLIVSIDFPLLLHFECGGIVRADGCAICRRQWFTPAAERWIAVSAARGARMWESASVSAVLSRD
jgi:hypothetical protein